MQRCTDVKGEEIGQSRRCFLSSESVMSQKISEQIRALRAEVDITFDMRLKYQLYEQTSANNNSALFNLITQWRTRGGRPSSPIFGSTHFLLNLWQTGKRDKHVLLIFRFPSPYNHPYFKPILFNLISMSFCLLNGEAKQKLTDLMIKLVPVEPEEQTKFKAVWSWGVYFMNYLTILFIVSHRSFSKVHSSVEVIVALNIVRAASNLAYIISKMKIFFVVQKMCILAHCVFTCNGLSQFFKPLLILDVTSAVVWALSIEQKYLHFDSRLFVGPSLLKQLATMAFYFLWVSAKLGVGFQQLFYIGFGAILLMIDLKNNYYSQKFKKLMLGLDFCCMVSGMLPILYSLAPEVEKYHLAIVVINVLCVGASVRLSVPHFSILYELDPWLNNVQSQQILDYVICLQELIRCEESAPVLKYIVHHIRVCQVPSCFLKYHEKDNHHTQMRPQEVLKIFKAESLVILCKKYSILQEYLIFNIEVRTKQIRGCGDELNFFHRRQNLRFFNKIKNDSKTHKQNEEKVTSKLTIEVNLVPQIKQFTELGLQFWTELLQFKVNSTKLLEVGAKQVKIMKQLNKILGKNISMDLKSEEMVHYYFLYLLGQPDWANSEKSRILQIQDNLTGFTDASPTVLVSAEKENFLRITNANLAAVKATGFTKEEMTSITVDVLWDKEIREDHIMLAERRARYSKVSEGELIRSYAFLKNKFGYIVITDAVVYYFDDLTGKKWCVVFYSFLENEPILVTNSRRELIGISDPCISYGLRTDLEGLKINEIIFSSCSKKSKPIDLVAGMNIFENNDFTLVQREGCDYYIKFETKIDFMGKPCYYVFSLGTKKSKNSSRDSVSQIEFKFLSSTRSSISKNNQSSSSIPSFEFHYNLGKNVYENNKIEMEMRALERNEVDEIEQSQFWTPKQTSADIIEMRLWNGKIDFLENLQSAVPAFDSLPPLMNQNQVLEEDKVKNQWKIRSQRAPTQIKWLRLILAIFVTLSLTMLIYINVMAMKDREQNKSQLNSHRTLIKQHEQMITLSSILIESLYRPEADIGGKLDSTIKEIDETYKKIEEMQNINNYVNSYDSQYSLFKADDIYRLLIKDYLSTFKHLDGVVLQLMNFISQGWHAITIFDFSMVETENAKILRNYLIFVALVFVFLVGSFSVHFQLRRKISQRFTQICQIFLSVDHRAIGSQVTKFKAFKDYIDLDRNLIKQESIGDLDEEENEENMYPKRAGNEEKYTIQSVMIGLGILVMGIYFGLTVKEQYKINSTLFSHFEYLHYSNLVVVECRRLWMGLHLSRVNREYLGEIEMRIYDYNRRFQFLNNQYLDNGYFSPNYQQFWLNLSYRDACQYMPEECNQQVKPIVKKGQKQLVYAMIRKFNKSALKFSLLEQFTASAEAAEMYKMTHFYLNQINQVIDRVIKQECQKLAEVNKSFLASFLGIYFASLLLIVLWYRSLAQKIRQISSLEDILHSLPFKELETNHKLIKYFKRVKINQR